MTAAVNKLVEVTNRDAVDIRALARIAESRDRRISDIEGRRAQPRARVFDRELADFVAEASLAPIPSKRIATSRIALD